MRSGASRSWSSRALGNGDARALFESVFPYRLDGPVLDRIVAETHGNPLALLELPRGLSPAQLAGGFGLPVSVPLAGRIEESFRRRLAGLSSPSRRLLLVAAADPTGDAALVWRAAGLLGIADSAEDAVEAEGLVDLTAGVVFRHPLVRSAALRRRICPGAKTGAPGVGGGHRSRRRPGSPNLAPGPGHVATR